MANLNNQQRPSLLQARMVLVTMDDRELLTNKIVVNATDNNKNKVHCEHPVKKCHFLEGKYFIVIDQLITERLDIFHSENAELYFQQEVNEEGSIILRPFNMKKGI